MPSAIYPGIDVLWQCNDSRGVACDIDGFDWTHGWKVTSTKGERTAVHVHDDCRNTTACPTNGRVATQCEIGTSLTPRTSAQAVVYTDELPRFVSY
jgi:hypothetical protein